MKTHSIYRIVAEQMKVTSFPILFAYLRNRTGLSARALSIKSGLSPSYVSKLERGEMIPTLDGFGRLIKNLDCTDQEVVVLVYLSARPKNV